jgi:hypothetical protein
MTNVATEPKANPHLPHDSVELASPPPPDARDTETARRNAERLVAALMQESGGADGAAAPHAVDAPADPATAGDTEGLPETAARPDPVASDPVPTWTRPVPPAPERPLRDRRAPTRAVLATAAPETAAEPALRDALTAGCGSRRAAGAGPALAGRIWAAVTGRR